MHLILALRDLVLFRLARRDLVRSTRLARRAADRLQASGWLPATYTPSRVPVCVRARWRA